ncbi:hypothetical protein MHU86_664 [Fragilaria crotonensis]|nr:hypothetical protein MHU86_664 [Fragilaria crotonensis]
MLSAAHQLRRPQLLKAAVRCMPSSANVNSPIVLYQRAKNRVMILRTTFFMSSFNAVYWIWYNVDFIPAINKSEVEAFHVDPVFGLLGLGFSAVVQAATLTYPRHLLSKLEYNETTQDLTVYMHDIPTIFQSTVGHTYPLGSITLDIASKSAKELVEAQEYFRGSVPLNVKGSSLPFILDLQEGDKVDHERVMPIIMTPEQWSIYRIALVSVLGTRSPSTTQRNETTDDERG